MFPFVTHRGFRYDLHPTPAQAEVLTQWLGVTRLVYNLCLEQRANHWRQYRRQTGYPLTWVAQCREITSLRRDFEWIEAVPRNVLDRAVKDLEAAFAAFFAGRAGFPNFRRRDLATCVRLKAEDVPVRILNSKWSAARLPKLGWIKFRDTRPMDGRLLSVSLRLKAGAWAIAFTRKVERKAVPASGTVGIDRGVAQTLSLSTGETVQSPRLSPLAKRRVRAQRRLSRRVRGSARRKVQKARVARLYAREGRVRTDWCHKTSTDIARRYGLVAIEALKIKNMTASSAGTLAEPGRGVAQKRGLNRSILEQCWGKFATFLEYKLAERGGVLISVPAAYTSQTCACCGVVDARSRKSQAVFQCVACNHTDNADVNAAKEILRRSTALLGGEGAHFAPAEPSIMAALAA